MKNLLTTKSVLIIGLFIIGIAVNAQGNSITTYSQCLKFADKVWIKCIKKASKIKDADLRAARELRCNVQRLEDRATCWQRFE